MMRRCCFLSAPPRPRPQQEDLEMANGVSAGKYTIGLGQEAMAFTG